MSKAEQCSFEKHVNRLVADIPASTSYEISDASAMKIRPLIVRLVNEIEKYIKLPNLNMDQQLVANAERKFLADLDPCACGDGETCTRCTMRQAFWWFVNSMRGREPGARPPKPSPVEERPIRSIHEQGKG